MTDTVRPPTTPDRSGHASGTDPVAAPAASRPRSQPPSPTEASSRGQTAPVPGRKEAGPSIPAECDVVVIGAGHNGLTAAAYLARAGKRVVVLEARDVPGGMAANRTIEPGFTAPHCAHLLHGLDPQVVRELDLYKHGLRFADRRVASTALCTDSDPLSLFPDLVRTRTGLARRSEEDAQGYARLMPRMTELAPRLASAMAASWAATGESADAAHLTLATAGPLQRLKADGARDLMRWATMRASDLLDARLDDPVLQGLLGFDAILGSTLPPSAPGSVLTWLHRLAGECAGIKGATGIVAGGMGALCEVLEGVAQSQGAQIHCNAPVRSIQVEGDRVRGVVLGSGREIRARAVVSSLNPQTTCLVLLGARWLTIETARRLKRWRSRGLTAKVNLSLNGLPDFAALTDEQLGGRLVLSGTLSDLEAAYRPVKYGDLGSLPPMEAVIPSLSDPSLAPEGGHVMSVILQYVPYVPDGAANEALRRQISAQVVKRLSVHAPDLHTLVRRIEVFTPRDIEGAFGTGGGHWHHGDIALDQMGAGRRVQGLLVRGLTLCGAGSASGGGVTGTPGRLGARLALESLEAP